MDSIRFRAPLKAPAGIFYIDRVMLSIDDARYQWSDDHVKTRYQIPEINFRLPAKLPAPTAGEIAAADDIRGALIRVFTEGQGGENGLVVVDNREKLRAHFAALKFNVMPMGNYQVGILLQINRRCYINQSLWMILISSVSAIMCSWVITPH